MKLLKTLGFVSIVITLLLGACGPAKTELLPTATNPPPTPTSPPTPIPGWNKITGANIEMWFLGNWEGGDIQNDLDVIVAKLKTLGSEFDQVIQMIETNPNAFVLWVFDTDFGDTGFFTNLNIVKEEVVSVITVDKYIEAVKGQLPSSMTIIDQKMIKLNKYDAARLEIDMDISGITAREVIYVVKEGNTVYSITFATHADEFEARVPIFEQIVGTFTILE